MYFKMPSERIHFSSSLLQRCDSSRNHLAVFWMHIWHIFPLFLVLLSIFCVRRCHRFRRWFCVRHLYTSLPRIFNNHRFHRCLRHYVFLYKTIRHKVCLNCLFRSWYENVHSYFQFEPLSLFIDQGVNLIEIIKMKMSIAVL